MTTTARGLILAQETPPAIGIDAKPRCQSNTHHGDWLTGHFNRLYAIVYRYLLHRVFDPEVAEELTAETFFRAVDAGERLPKDIGEVQAWLLRVATNAANTRHRRRCLREKLLGRYRRHRQSQAAPETHASEKDARRARIRQAILSLCPKDQAVIAMRFYSHMSHRDIAGVLGISELAVRSRLSRAVNKVRRRVASAKEP